MTLPTPELAMRYGAAWAAHDPDAIASFHTDDTVCHMHGLVDPIVGRETVRAAVAMLLEQSPDLAFDGRRVFLGADHFVSDYEMSGTVNGSRFVCDGVDVFPLRDGLIARKDSYLDSLGYQRQTRLELPAKIELEPATLLA